MGIKADFIDALRDTPDGIKNFLLTPIPEPPDVDYPTTKDESVVVQGVLAAYVLKFFKPFAGFTPVEAVLHVGQHSNPLEAITLSILEYLQESNSQKDFTILEPTAGKTYTPGDVRVAISSKDSSISSAVVSIAGGETPLSPNEDGSIYFGYVRCSEPNTYTVDISVKFNDKAGTVKTGQVVIQVDIKANTPEAIPPEGEDLTSFDTALSVLDDYYQKAINKASQEGEVTIETFTDIEKAANIVYDIAKSIPGVAESILSNFAAAAQALRS